LDNKLFIFNNLKFPFPDPAQAGEMAPKTPVFLAEKIAFQSSPRVISAASSAV